MTKLCWGIWQVVFDRTEKKNSVLELSDTLTTGFPQNVSSSASSSCYQFYINQKQRDGQYLKKEKESLTPVSSIYHMSIYHEQHQRPKLPSFRKDDSEIGRFRITFLKEHSYGWTGLTVFWPAFHIRKGVIRQDDLCTFAWTVKITFGLC